MEGSHFLKNKLAEYYKIYFSKEPFFPEGFTKEERNLPLSFVLNMSLPAGTTSLAEMKVRLPKQFWTGLSMTLTRLIVPSNAAQYRSMREVYGMDPAQSQ